MNIAEIESKIYSAGSFVDLVDFFKSLFTPSFKGLPGSYKDEKSD